MRPFLPIVAISALALSAATPAHALFGHGKPAHIDAGPQQINCAAVAANPHSGMDMASCEAMNKAAADYYAAQHDPAAQRPGDEDMTCDQIKAEFMNQPVVPPPQEHVAAAQEAGRDFQAKTAQVQGEAAAAAAAQTVVATAASTAAALSPVGGNAINAAAAAANQASQAAFNAHAEAVMRPASQKFMSTSATIVGDATAQLQGNPRIARLVQLANDKSCQF